MPLLGEDAQPEAFTISTFGQPSWWEGWREIWRHKSTYSSKFLHLDNWEIPTVIIISKLDFAQDQAGSS